MDLYRPDERAVGCASGARAKQGYFRLFPERISETGNPARRKWHQSTLGGGSSMYCVTTDMTAGEVGTGSGIGS